MQVTMLRAIAMMRRTRRVRTAGCMEAMIVISGHCEIQVGGMENKNARQSSTLYTRRLRKNPTPLGVGYAVRSTAELRPVAKNRK